MMNRLMALTRLTSPTSGNTPALPSTGPSTSMENRVDDLVSSMSGLFRRATNFFGFGSSDALPGAHDGDIIYCKNNVCVHAPTSVTANTNAASTGSSPNNDEDHHPGYFTIRCQDDQVLGKTLVLTWIPNSTLAKNPNSLQTTPDKVSPVDPSASRTEPLTDTSSVEMVEHSEPSSSASATEMGFTMVETPELLSARKKELSLDLQTHQTEPEAGYDTVLVGASSADPSPSSSSTTSGPDSPDEESVSAAKDIQVHPAVGDNATNRSSDWSNTISREQVSCGVFSVDLGLMRSVRLFYTDTGPGRSGQLVIASPESQYKVFHFHNGGLERLEVALEGWRFLTRQKSQKHEAAERYYKQYTIVRPRFSVSHRHPEEGQHVKVTAEVWRSYMSPDGRIEEVFLLRKAIFFGGLDPALRGEAWPFLLKYYCFESTLEERENVRNDKFLEYQEIRAIRAAMKPEAKENFYTTVQCIVEKDVVRTDRRHPYYAGEGNGNIDVLKEILLDYAASHPETGYMQGMSDLLAPILAEVRNQADAYWCFEGLMQRTIFVSSPKDNDMDRQLGYLRELLRLVAPEFSAHLDQLGGDASELLFCHRWILLCFKREFGEGESLRVWEACWVHYQTDYFHLFVCVAIIHVYGEEVIRDRLSADEMLLYFASLAMHMDADLVLVHARWLLHAFRSRETIPCSLSGLCLLCGPGMWDSGHVPAVRCVGHPPDVLCPHQPTSPGPTTPLRTF